MRLQGWKKAGREPGELSGTWIGAQIMADMIEKNGFPVAPAIGQRLSAAWPSPIHQSWLALRRSTPIALLSHPGPQPDLLAEILRVGMRVPDHGKLAPWRVLIFAGAAREPAGERLARCLIERDPAASTEMQTQERQRFMRAPVVLGIVSNPVDSPKIPEWEQILSAGALCYNLLLAAQSAGFAGVWLTESCAYERNVAETFGLADSERFAGFVYLGTARDAPIERERPMSAEKMQYWTPDD